MAAYKRVRPFMVGDFYPLLPHSDAPDTWYGYQFHRPDRNAGVAFAFRREKCAGKSAVIRLRALHPDSEYEMTFDDGGKTRTIRQRANAPVEVEVGEAPGACLVYYRSVAR